MRKEAPAEPRVSAPQRRAARELEGRDKRAPPKRSILQGVSVDRHAMLTP